MSAVEVIVAFFHSGHFAGKAAVVAEVVDTGSWAVAVVELTPSWAAPEAAE